MGRKESNQTYKKHHDSPQIHHEYSATALQLVSWHYHSSTVVALSWIVSN